MPFSWRHQTYDTSLLMQRRPSYQPDEERMQTDGRTAFQLYIVDRLEVCDKATNYISILTTQLSQLS